MRPSSVRTQIVIWNTLTLAAILLMLGIVVRQMTVRAVYGSVEAEMMHRIGPLLDGHFDGPGPPPGPPDERGRPRGGGLRQHRYDLKGECLPEDEDCTVWDAEALRHAQQERIQFSNVTVDGEPIHVLTAMVPLHGSPIGYVQVPYPTFDIDRSLRIVDSTLLFLAPLALLVAALGGWAMAGRMLVPVRAIAAAAGRISGANLGERVPVRGTDEFAGLGDTVNAMLDRLEDSARQQSQLIEQQRRFTADASHELKTPLTTIKANAQLALSQDQPEGYRQSMSEISRAASDMDHLVQDLLLLARSDSGQLGRNQIELLIGEVLERAVERTNRPGLANVEIHLADDGETVLGNENEMIRLFSNLLDNARRFSPPDVPVTVTARREGQHVFVDIVDGGPGVSPEQLGHLGERFFRADSSRSRMDGGSGLGLSICRSIAEAHGWEIGFSRPEVGGLRASLRMP